MASSEAMRPSYEGSRGRRSSNEMLEDESKGVSMVEHMTELPKPGVTSPYPLTQGSKS